MSRYLVTAPHPYREHKPGDTFEAELDLDVEQRAIRLGAIRLLERCTTGLRPGSWQLPHGWIASNPVSGREPGERSE